MKNSKYSVLAYESLSESKHDKYDIAEALTADSDVTLRDDPVSFQKEMNRKNYDIIFMDIKPDNGATFQLLKKVHEVSPYTR